jgi:ribonucleotide monophosphatase NagD (HAD superfamily)
MKIKEIANSVDYAKNYKVILCDLWGVIHNGKQLFENSISFLREMKSNDIKIFFLSNAPRPNYIVEEGLNNKLGLNKNLYDGIITSGDIACNYINRKIHGESYFHMGPKKDY